MSVLTSKDMQHDEVRKSIAEKAPAPTTDITSTAVSPGEDNNVTVEETPKGYKYKGRMRELVEGYNAVAQILFPRYPWYLFPGYLQLALIRRYLKHFKGKYRLVPIPNGLYDILTASEFLKSEHILFAHPDVYEQFVLLPEINFVHVHLTPRKDNDEYDDSNPLAPITVQLLPKSNCPKNFLYIKENFYANLLNRVNCLYTSTSKSCHIWIELHKPSEDKETATLIPEIGGKAYIYMLPNPYELPTDLIDIILQNYFRVPRLWHCKYCYRIAITTDLIGTAQYARFYTILAYVKEVYFYCTHIENNTGQKMNRAVILKDCTSLVQIKHTLSFLPSQLLDNLSMLPSYPLNVHSLYQKILRSLDAFLPREGNVCLSSQQISPVFMLHGARGSGKNKLIQSIANELGLHLYGADCTDIINQIPAQTETNLKTVFAKAALSQPLIICFHNFELFGVDAEGNEDLRLLAAFQLQIEELFVCDRKYPIIVMVLNNDRSDVKPMIQRLFLEIFHLDEPNHDERYTILKWLHCRELTKQFIYNQQRIDELPFTNDFLRTMILPKTITEILNEVAKKTQGFVLSDLELLYNNTIRQLSITSTAITRNSTKPSSIPFDSLTLEHFEKSLTTLQATFANRLGAPKVPRVLWSDIGGLAKLKDEIQSSIGLPLKYVHLMDKSLRRSGILLYGPPGTGKTLVAKAVATECNLNFLSVQGPELLNMYVGQSEQNVRDIFSRARSAAPCVIFLDELDSLAPNRGVAGDSGGVMDRVVSQLLAEMDTLGDLEKPVFILAATNRPDLIDSALLRPGRFDKLFFVGPCSTTEEKLSVLNTQTKNFYLAKDCDLREFAESLKDEMSGADLYSICSNAWLSAVRRVIQNHRKGEIKEDELLASNVIVQMNDFLQAYSKFVPSISKEDMNYFNNLKLTYTM